MVNIIARDLIKLYPQNKAKIEKNITKFTADLLKIENEANESCLQLERQKLYLLSENLQYFEHLHYHNLHILCIYSYH